MHAPHLLSTLLLALAMTAPTHLAAHRGCPAVRALTAQHACARWNVALLAWMDHEAQRTARVMISQGR